MLLVLNQIVSLFYGILNKYNLWKQGASGFFIPLGYPGYSYYNTELR